MICLLRRKFFTFQQKLRIYFPWWQGESYKKNLEFFWPIIKAIKLEPSVLWRNFCPEYVTKLILCEMWNLLFEAKERSWKSFYKNFRLIINKIIAFIQSKKAHYLIKAFILQQIFLPKNFTLIKRYLGFLHNLRTILSSYVIGLT